MKKLGYIFFLFIIITSCSKEKEDLPTVKSGKNPWIQKYIGDYKVYDTTGVFLYNMSISHYIGISQTSGNDLDSILITNFADTFDLRFQFDLNFYTQSFEQDYLNIGFNDPVVDYNNKTWGVGGIFDDTTTIVKENALINDTMVMYFRQNNIRYYIPEAQPYYYCECKHVAVKQ